MSRLNARRTGLGHQFILEVFQVFADAGPCHKRGHFAQLTKERCQRYPPSDRPPRHLPRREATDPTSTATMRRYVQPGAPFSLSMRATSMAHWSGRRWAELKDASRTGGLREVSAEIPYPFADFLAGTGLAAGK